MITPHKILLIDRQPLIRLGLQKLLEKSPDLELRWQCPSFAEAFALLDHDTPDLIVSEALLPGDECVLSFIKDVQAVRENLPLLVLSERSETLLADRVLRAGASGFVNKSASPTEVLQAMRTALRGEIYMNSRTASRIFRQQPNHSNHSNHLNHSDPSNPVERLSDRELEVFNLIGEGFTSREIAGKLNISIKTIESHRLHIKEKILLPENQGLVSFASQWIAFGKVYGDH